VVARGEQVVVDLPDEVRADADRTWSGDLGDVRDVVDEVVQRRVAGGIEEPGEEVDAHDPASGGDALELLVGEVAVVVAQSAAEECVAITGRRAISRTCCTPPAPRCEMSSRIPRSSISSTTATPGPGQPAAGGVLRRAVGEHRGGRSAPAR